MISAGDLVSGRVKIVSEGPGWRSEQWFPAKYVRYHQLDPATRWGLVERVRREGFSSLEAMRKEGARLDLIDDLMRDAFSAKK